MKSDEVKQEVEQWIADGCDYDHGVILYQKFGKNKTLMKIFPGKEKRMAIKLKYELCKTVGINHQTSTPKIQQNIPTIKPVDTPIDIKNEAVQETEKAPRSIFSYVRNLFK